MFHQAVVIQILVFLKVGRRIVVDVCVVWNVCLEQWIVDRDIVIMLTEFAGLFGMNREILFLVLGLLFFGFVSGAVVDESIYEKFGEGNEKVPVIVEKVKDSERISTLNEVAIEKIAERGDKFSAVVSEEELELLLSDSKIGEVRMNFPLKAFLGDSVGIVGANSSWELNVGEVNLIGGVQSVCILDSGINNFHSDFSGRILDEKCFCSVSDSGGGGCCPNGADVDDNATDDNGHGTHVAGIVGASGEIDGIATGVGLVIVKILNGTGDGSSFDLEDGIQWCLDNAATYNISVITASLGGATKYTSADQAACDSLAPGLTSKINAAFAENISITIATGNFQWNDGITWPSCVSTATPVGAVKKDDSLYYSRNSFVKLFGVGYDVNSTSYSGGYTVQSGTSMATPMVAGAIAIINQYLLLSSRTMNPSEIEEVLYNTGKTIIEGSNNFSRINIYSAILSLDVNAPNVTLVSPVNEHINLTENQTFVCNATDWQLANVTLKVWNTTGLYYNFTNNLTGTSNSSSFNLTNMSTGTYVWNCLVTDVLGNSNYSVVNFSLSIGGVVTTLVSPRDESYTSINETNFSCNASSDSGYDLSNLTFYLWNSSELIYNLSVNVSGVTNSSTFNYNFSSETNYSWNCFSMNNISNSSWRERNFSLVYDVTPPLINLSSVADGTSTTIEFNFNVSEINSIANCSVYVDGLGTLNTSVINNSGANSISVSGLSFVGHSAYVNCSDKAGNVGNSSEISFTISSPPAVNSGGGGGGGGGRIISSASTLEIYKVTSSEVFKGYTKTLKKNEKMNFSIFDFSGGRHLLTVNDVGEDYVNLTIESNPINLTLGVGQSVKLNLTSADYYDLYIKLNLILNGGAELTIQSISEPIEKVISEIVKETEIVEVESPIVEEYFKVTLILAVLLVLIVFVAIRANRKRLKEGINKKTNGKKKKSKA